MKPIYKPEPLPASVQGPSSLPELSNPNSPQYPNEPNIAPPSNEVYTPETAYPGQDLSKPNYQANVQPQNIAKPSEIPSQNPVNSIASELLPPLQPSSPESEYPSIPTYPNYPPLDTENPINQVAPSYNPQSPSIPVEGTNDYSPQSPSTSVQGTNNYNNEYPPNPIEDTNNYNPGVASNQPYQPTEITEYIPSSPEKPTSTIRPVAAKPGHDITFFPGLIHPPTEETDKPPITGSLPPGVTVSDMTELLYRFNYSVGFHGHYETGYRSGARIGGYYVNYRDGYSRIVEYVADERGYRPKTSIIYLGLDSPDIPKEETEKNYGLKGQVFEWFSI